ncbi:MAG: protein translocase subunit SecF [Deltaproteobacteria bacterium]|nr:protein translocase subunit SecF [Deltaproteobacteria bacterium]
MTTSVKKQTATNSAQTKQSFFRLVPIEPNFQFIAKAPIFFTISGLFIAFCVYALITQGLNYGIDFKGGTELYLRFTQATDAEQIRQTLKPLGYDNANVQRYGNENQYEFLIRVQPEDLQLTQYVDAIQKTLNSFQKGDDDVRVRFSEERLYAIFDDAVSTDAIKTAVNQITEGDLVVQYVTPFGKVSGHEYLVQFSGVSTKMIAGLTEAMGAENMEVLQIEEVGEKVGSELRRQAVGAVIISILFILVYIWFRFEFEFAPGAIVALIHDTLAVLGVFALMRLPFDLSTVAAMLTIVGFSINDTIVTYDRIRENVKKLKNVSFPEIVNMSINQTLSRTVLTSLTLLIATLMLLFFGGVITQTFALALTLGVVFGTYSSIVIAAPLTIYLRKKFVAKV